MSGNPERWTQNEGDSNACGRCGPEHDRGRLNIYAAASLKTQAISTGC
jgi:hypothetical protein